MTWSQQSVVDDHTNDNMKVLTASTSDTITLNG